MTAVVTEGEGRALTLALNREPALLLTVDFEAQSILCGELRCQFKIDPARGTRLLNGWDDIDLTDSFREQNDAFKSANLQRVPPENDVDARHGVGEAASAG